MELAEWPGILEQARARSMASDVDIAFTAERAVSLIEQGIPGAIVECGVWQGGCSIGTLLAQRAHFGEVQRTSYLLDSFEGLPPVTEKDGPLAAAWQADTESPAYYDNCSASLEDLRAALSALELPSGSWELMPGWFDDTVPVLAERLAGEGISLLRLDGDWYDSTMVCLEHLMPLVADEGVVIVDDYYAWDGCARALHDYLSRHDVPYRIRDIHGGIGAFFVKRGARTAEAPFKD